MTAKTYDRQTAKFLAVVGENMPDLSGDVMQKWIQNPKAVQKALSNAFCPPEAATPRFDIWKTIKLGTGLKIAVDFRCALSDGKFRFSRLASDILGKPVFTAADEETELDLVKVTVAELGFKNGIMFDQIYERAKELGLELCPSEVGPQLRLQYKDQPNGEWILVAMEPIIDSEGYSDIFRVGHHGSGVWLDGFWHFQGLFWAPDLPWVFCLPRK